MNTNNGEGMTNNEEGSTKDREGMTNNGEGSTKDGEGTTKDGEGTTKDPYGDFRHFNFQYLHYYLVDFFRTHGIFLQHVINDAGFGGHTLSDLLNGKDMRLNCYIRLLATMRMYCEDDDRYMDFIMGFIKRAIVDVWLKWRLSPEGWMKEVWREMEMEKMKYYAKEKLEVQRNITTFTGVKK